MEFILKVVLSCILILVSCGILCAFSAGPCANVSCADRVGSGVQIQPAQVLEFSYRTTQQLVGVAALDIVVIVSAARDNLDHQRWLQIAIPNMEILLKSLGIGADVTMPNRYCLVQFGGRAIFSTAKFITVNSQKFSPASSFVIARRQLVRIGSYADGYDAINFTLRNAPFRNASNVAKLVVMVTNHRRTVLNNQANLTRNIIGNLLRDTEVFFSVIVATNISVISTTLPSHTPVIGLTSYHQGVITGRNWSYEFVDGKAVLQSNKGEIVRDYVVLALNVGGMAWSLDVLQQENTTVVKSFLGAMISGHGIQAEGTVEVCQRCWCVEEEGGVCRREECEVASNQDDCYCWTNNPPKECDLFITPSPVISTVSSTFLPTPTPIFIEVRGTVSMGPGRTVRVDFSSNKNRATYSCILLDGTTPTPLVTSCVSPFIINNALLGPHSLLVIARRKGYFGSRLFDLEIEPEGRSNQSLKLMLSKASELVNGSLAVEIGIKNGMPGTRVDLRCSLGEDDFVPCTSPYLVTAESIGGNGTPLLVVGFSSQKRIAIGRMNLTLPTHNSPIRIVVDPPDSLGRVTISVSTSRPDTSCYCKTNSSNFLNCTGEYRADPRILGPGNHTFMFVCMHYVNMVGYSESGDFNVILPSPPPLARRKCCPLIDGAHSALQSNASHLSLDLQVLPGNCTRSEGFSYKIDWGDFISDTGESLNLKSIIASKSFDAVESSLPGEISLVEVTHCNYPAVQENKCCDTLTFLFRLPV